MKHELFVEQPVLDLKEGVKVTNDTVLSFANKKVEQELKNLVLETIMQDAGTNGTNTYKSKSYISLTLNPGDILLFDDKRGYYLAAFPVVSIDDAISDITALETVPRFKDLG